MRPSKKKSDKETPEPKSRLAKSEPEPPQLPKPAEAENSEPTGERVAINFYMTDDGKIDISRMREAMKERVKELMPQLVAEFAPDQKQEVLNAIPAGWVDTLYNGIGALESIIFQRTLGIDQETASAVFAFTKVEKEQLIPPTVAVLNKRLPDWFLKYKDEISLVMLLVMITLAKVQIAKTMSAMKKALPANREQVSPAAATEHGPNGEEKPTAPDAPSADAAGEKTPKAVN